MSADTLFSLSGSHEASELTDTVEGVLPMDRLSVRPLGSRQAASLVVEHHYLHRRPSISESFGLFLSGICVGVVTFGSPASRHLQMGACKSDPDKVVELNRLWVSDSLPRNAESWFVSRALKLMPPRIVVSYADTSRHHYGYVYRALNFRYAGWTDMDRKTPRYDYVAKDPTKHTRESSRSGVAYKVRRIPKVKYWTVTGDRRARRHLTRLCTWPDLDWSNMPPPQYVSEAVEATA